MTLATETRPIDAAGLVSSEVSLMGGRVGIHQRAARGASRSESVPDTTIESDARRILRTMGAWAARLTRFDPDSELSRLNADPRVAVPIGPTLAAVLDWGRAAEVETDGIVNIAMLDRRLASEDGVGYLASPVSQPVPTAGSWSLERSDRGALVRRPTGLRFDLDGIAKGWLADRAIGRLRYGRTAVVDADGDLAVRLSPGATWDIGIADTIDLDQTIAVLRLDSASRFEGAEFGVATSGTSVHRWASHTDLDPTDSGRPTHHLIDPRTGLPAITDIVQATVVARSARVAEAFAKAAVILGSAEALRSLDRPPIDGLLLLTEDRRVLATPRTLRYMA